MNSKIVLTTSSLMFFLLGILTSFAPELLLAYLEIDYSLSSSLLTQSFGAFNIAMGILNWMTKSSIFGGIYNRPIAMANLAYFFMTGLAIIKGLLNISQSSVLLWVIGLSHLIFAITFWRLLFKNPISTN